jgi:hypothetical protein
VSDMESTFVEQGPKSRAFTEHTKEEDVSKFLGGKTISSREKGLEQKYILEDSQKQEKRIKDYGVVLADAIYQQDQRKVGVAIQKMIEANATQGQIQSAAETHIRNRFVEPEIRNMMTKRLNLVLEQMKYGVQ